MRGKLTKRENFGMADKTSTDLLGKAMAAREALDKHVAERKALGDKIKKDRADLTAARKAVNAALGRARKPRKKRYTGPDSTGTSTTSGMGNGVVGSTSEDNEEGNY